MPYLTQELRRCVTWSGHQEVCLRTGNEPSTLSLPDSSKKGLKGLGVHVTVELVVPGNKEANGAAEVTVQTIRNQANLLSEQVERELGADGKLSVHCVLFIHGPSFTQAGSIADLQSTMVKRPLNIVQNESIMARFVGLERCAWDF